MRNQLGFPLFLFSVLASGCGGDKTNNGPGKVNVPLVDAAPVEVRDLVRSVGALGTLESVMRVRVSSEIQGVITKTPRAEGELITPRWIEAEQRMETPVLFELDARELDNDVRAAEQNLGQAANSIENAGLLAQTAELEDKAAALAVSAATLALQHAGEQTRLLNLDLTKREKDFDRAAKMLAGQALTPKAFEDAKLARDRAQVTARQSAVETQQAEVKLNQAKNAAALSEVALSQAKLKQSQAKIARTQAELAVERAQLHRAKATIHAPPFAGRVGESRVRAGDFVKEGDVLVEYVKIDPIEAVFTVPERYRGDLRKGLPVSLRPDATTSVSDKAAGVIDGDISFIDPSIDSATRSVRLKASLPNPKGALQPGQFVRVTLTLGEERTSIVVPEEAVVPRGEEFFVYVVVDGKASKRKVALGQRLPGAVVIESGLKREDTVITGGLQRVSDGFAVKIRESKGPAAPPKNPQPPQPPQPKK